MRDQLTKAIAVLEGMHKLRSKILGLGGAEAAELESDGVLEALVLATAAMRVQLETLSGAERVLGPGLAVALERQLEDAARLGR